MALVNCIHIKENPVDLHININFNYPKEKCASCDKIYMKSNIIYNMTELT